MGCIPVMALNGFKHAVCCVYTHYECHTYVRHVHSLQQVTVLHQPGTALCQIEQFPFVAYVPLVRTAEMETGFHPCDPHAMCCMCTMHTHMQGNDVFKLQRDHKASVLQCCATL